MSAGDVESERLIGVSGVVVDVDCLGCCVSRLCFFAPNRVERLGFIVYVVVYCFRTKLRRLNRVKVNFKPIWSLNCGGKR